MPECFREKQRPPVSATSTDRGPRPDLSRRSSRALYPAQIAPCAPDDVQIVPSSIPCPRSALIRDRPWRPSPGVPGLRARGVRITKSVGRTGERWGPKGKRTEQGVEARAVRDALAHLDSVAEAAEPVLQVVS